MAEAVAKVARRINETVEEGKDSLDLSNCKLISFPDGVFKVLRSVSENICVVTLADNELKAISSKFFSTFTQLRDKLTEIATLETINLEGNSITEIPVEKLSNMPALKWLNLKSNLLDSNTQSALQSPHKFDILSTTES
ncbi:Leucine-rich repeat-containing protein 20 isoform 4 [Scophthalmus maximus]|uniref:Leucine-rich repeat-containing protein 20 isoform 4 n=1 Tax=Scophthalmus maximus TaxID=52904 RepID=A0A2U9CPR2_SCOMX|nr:Leucine-rich repeat-containing protein 20 isoform 4 [Scophthalmus maximus]